MQLLHSARFISRRKNGLFVYLERVDDDVLRLCEMVCGRLEDETTAVRALARDSLTGDQAWKRIRDARNALDQ